MTKHILIADDSERLVSALKIQLEAQGFDVVTCTDSYMALSLAHKCRPDVMILDIRMPAGDGFSVLERMAKLPELRGIPVIYITGDKSVQIDARAEQMGARGIIYKPISLSALLNMIDAALDKQKMSPTEPAVFDVSADTNITDIPGVI